MVGSKGRGLAWLLSVVGAIVCALGLFSPNLIGGGARPYAYLSAVAVGAMLILVGAMLWGDT